MFKKEYNKKYMKKTLCIALILSVSLSVTGCGSKDTGKDTEKNTNYETTMDEFYPSTTPKEFSNEYLTITLTDDYEELETNDYLFNYSSQYTLCFGMSETKESVAAAGYTIANLDEYAVFAMQSAGITAEVTPYNDTTRLITWNKTINDIHYCYKAYITENESSYWLFQFAAQKDVFEVLNSEYDNYYNSITFKK